MGLKIGHAGTLDPLASGILPLALGEATKTVPYMMDADKAYAFTVTWGEERDTDDSEGRVTATSDKRPSESEIQAILGRFTGVIRQAPPAYSAIKVEGKRAYELARGGEAVELREREVQVYSLSLWERARVRAVLPGECSSLGIGPHPSPLPEGEGDSSFLCHCSKGTYIRSLARDMGRMLGCLGHISQLRRTRVGKFDQAHAISLEILEKMVHKGDLGFLRPVESALDDIPAVTIDPSQAARLRRGQNVVLPFPAETPVMIARCDGKLIAICEREGGQLRPKRVFNL